MLPCNINSCIYSPLAHCTENKHRCRHAMCRHVCGRPSVRCPLHIGVSVHCITRRARASAHALAVTTHLRDIPIFWRSLRLTTLTFDWLVHRLLLSWKMFTTNWFLLLLSFSSYDSARGKQADVHCHQHSLSERLHSTIIIPVIKY